MSVYLLIVAFRNLSEVSAAGVDLDYVLFSLCGPLAMVWVSEILVDWLKHAFITKFNHIHPEVYARFMDTLALDLCHISAKGSLADQSPAVSRRIGFSSFPLTCLLIRVLMQTLGFASVRYWSWNGIVRALLYFLLYIFKRFCLYCNVMRCRILLVKVTLGMSLIAYTRARNAQNLHHYSKADPNIAQSPVKGADSKTNDDGDANNNKAKIY